MRKLHPRLTNLLSSAACLSVMLLSATGANAQSPPAKWPLLPEEDEIKLALNAAPAEVSANADVWVLRKDGYAKARSGTSGIACIVLRDHPESLYPICYDAESARTILPISMREQLLRAKGLDDAAVDAAIKAGIEKGEFNLPKGSAFSWMLSPKQVIYAGAAGRRVGQWYPHIMIYMPYMTRAKLGFESTANGDYAIADEGKATAHLIVITGSFGTN